MGKVKWIIRPRDLATVKADAGIIRVKITEIETKLEELHVTLEVLHEREDELKKEIKLKGGDIDDGEEPQGRS